MVRRRTVVGGVAGLLSGAVLGDALRDDGESFVGSIGQEAKPITTMSSADNTPIHVFGTYSEMDNFEPDQLPAYGLILETNLTVEWVEE